MRESKHILNRQAKAVLLAMLVGATAAGEPAQTPALLDLQARINAASPGETLIVPAGRYAPIHIDKPITLVGEGAPVIDGKGHGDVVRISGPFAATIRGFVIQGSGSDLDQESTGLRVMQAQATIENCRFDDVLFGIDLKQASKCVIRGNHLTSKPLDVARRGDVIRLFRSDDCLIENNVIEDGRDALIWYSNRITIRDNISRRNRYGFHGMYANDVTFEGNRLEGNSVGIYLMYGQGFTIARNQILRNRGVSGYGIGLKEVDRYAIHDNLLVGNRVGAYIDGSPLRRRAGQANFGGNTLACNDVGMMLLPSVKGNRIVNNNFIDNVEQIGVQGRGAVEQNEFVSPETGRGNYWGDYNGFDANHDGIGDRAYASTKLFEDLIQREPKLRLFLFSPAHSAIEFIGRAMPATRPEPKFSDAAPLMEPVAAAAITPSRTTVDAAPRAGQSMSLAAVALAALATMIVAFGFAGNRFQHDRAASSGRLETRRRALRRRVAERHR